MGFKATFKRILNWLRAPLRSKAAKEEPQSDIEDPRCSQNALEDIPPPRCTVAVQHGSVVSNEWSLAVDVGAPEFDDEQLYGK